MATRWTASNLPTAFPTDDGPVPSMADGRLAIEPGQTPALARESGSGKSVTRQTPFVTRAGATRRCPYRRHGGTGARRHIAPVVLRAWRDLAEKRRRITTPTTPPIEVRHLRKKFSKADRPVRVVDDVCFAIQPGGTRLKPKMGICALLGEAQAEHGLASGQSERVKRIAELLDLVGLRPGHAQRCPHEFSGGQRQRIGIARALAVAPEFIVADEPLSALDVSIQSQVINLLADLRERLNLTLLFISHDLDVVEYLCDRVVVLYLGKVMEVAATDALFERPMHPYTRALLAASPKPDPTVPMTHIALQGDIPSPIAPPSGCVFRTRCPSAIAACAQQVPVLDEVAPGRWSAGIRKDIVMMEPTL